MKSTKEREKWEQNCRIPKRKGDIYSLELNYIDGF